MIQIDGLRFGYGPQRILDIHRLAVEQGGHLLLLGDSGSGKTTLLHLLAGLLRPAQGEIIVADQPLARMSGAALDKFRGQRVGLVFQQPHLVGALSVRQNLTLAQYLAGLPPDPERVDEMLSDLGLDHRQAARPSALSQGEAQRVTLARALLNKPRIILADEPTASLDDDHCQRVLALLQRQARKYHATLLIATHDQRIKARVAEHRTLVQGQLSETTLP